MEEKKELRPTANSARSANVRFAMIRRGKWVCSSLSVDCFRNSEISTAHLPTCAQWRSAVSIQLCASCLVGVFEYHCRLSCGQSDGVASQALKTSTRLRVFDSMLPGLTTWYIPDGLLVAPTIFSPLPLSCYPLPPSHFRCCRLNQFTVKFSFDTPTLQIAMWKNRLKEQRSFRQKVFDHREAMF
jgi:hypothetical protein